jgi:hypothetical protein
VVTSETTESGVVFPVSADGARSTSDLGRAVVADALRRVDEVGASSVERETNWRSGYLAHFRRLVEAGLLSRSAALTIASDGLSSLHTRMRVAADGGETDLQSWFDAAPRRELRDVTVTGTGSPDRRVGLPYRGELLVGASLDARLDGWVQDGIVEPSCASAVRAVRDHPEWLDLSDLTFAVLGAGAEMGPLPSLLRWGATVRAVDLPRPGLWQPLIDAARRSAGSLHLPVAASSPATDDDRLSDQAGVDLLTELPDVARWLQATDGRLVVGNYVYADGATNLRLSMAVDALTERLRAQHGDIAIAGLATPTDVFAVPRDAVAHSVQAYRERSAGRRLAGRTLRALSAGKLLQPNYLPTEDPGINDSLVPQQGPNYALAKRLQRWRAAVATSEGTAVSFNVAPPTRTRSVVKNRALAAAYAGAHRFGVEVFDPQTSNTLMALLLVHDLRSGRPASEHPWQDEAHASAHGGLWRSAYDPRSVLGLAAVLGLGAARS